MARALLLEELSSTGGFEIGRVERSDVSIGREPGEGGITASGNAVSRVHGKFIRARQHWLYMDLGSTNGSWLNGRQVTDGQIVLLRSGDILQLADSAVRILGIAEDGSVIRHVSEDPHNAMRSLLVFSAGQFVDEFPISEYGRSLVLGSSQGDIAVPGAEDVPALVVERRGAELVAFSLSQQVRAVCEGVDLSSVSSIKDGDRIRVGPFLVLVNNLDIAAASGTELQQPEAPASQEQSVLGSRFRDWDSGPKEPTDGDRGVEDRLRRRSSRLVFGQGVVDEQAEVAATVAMDPERVRESVARAERHPATRRLGDNPSIERGANIDDRLVLIIGFVLLLVLVVLALYWFLA